MNPSLATRLRADGNTLDSVLANFDYLISLSACWVLPKAEFTANYAIGPNNRVIVNP